MKIFGTDGVRGKAGELLTPFLVQKLGIAAGLYFKKTSITGKILVGKDTRRSGYMIENALVAALTSIGYDVIQIGPMPTPAVAFLVEDMRCDAGVMISASHNPFYDNGVKFFDRSGNKLCEAQEDAIESIYNDTKLLLNSFMVDKEIGTSKRVDDVIGRYIVHIKSSFLASVTLQGLRVVIDVANGAAYKVAPTILAELGADTITINDAPNGFNINEGCGAMHPESLARAVLKYRADIGFALDGDADRLVVVDNEGKIIDGDIILGVLALAQKRRGKLANNGAVITEMSNLALEEYLVKNKIEVIRTKVGDKYVLEAMQKEGYNFGGEQSGHIIFSDYAKTGDGLVSALQILALLKENTSLKSAKLFSPFTPYPSLLENIKVEEKKDLGKNEKLKSILASIKKANMRSLVRYSGTEMKLRILVEGKDMGLIKQYIGDIRGALGV